jgi:hypothetical protein
MTPTTASARSELAPYLLPGRSTIGVALDYRVAPASPRATVVTPAGTFHDLIGIEFSETGSSEQNVNAEGRHVLGSVFAAVGALIKSTIYFAPGVGPVLASSSLGPAVLERCSG